jgi:hypothetical protein
VCVVIGPGLGYPGRAPVRLLGSPAPDLNQYTNGSNSLTQRSDLATYRTNAGPVPGQASDTAFPDPEGAGARRFVIEVLYQAFNAEYSVDRVP